MPVLNVTNHFGSLGHDQLIISGIGQISALRFVKELIKYFREGVAVQACAYGGRITGKEYRFGISAETLKAFLELQILPDSDRLSDRSHCEACKKNWKHIQAACPQKGDDRERESIPGGTKKATKNRVPTLLAAVICRATVVGRQRSEERAERAHRKRKR